VHVSNLFYTEYPSLLAQKLARLSGLNRAFFSNSGTEAWEGALKIARAVASGKGLKKRTRILALENSFHGRTMGSVAPLTRRSIANVCSGDAGRDICEVQ